MKLLARVNQMLEASWAGGWLPEPVLDAQGLADRAREQEGGDFADDAWRAPLEVLTGELAATAWLNAFGRTMACGQLTKALRDRLRAEALWRRHPEILERPLPPPVIVLGSMRSGTTRVQRLLACDDRLAHTRLFESLSPLPKHAFEPRAAKIAGGLAFLKALDPALGRIHPTRARLPDEEFGLFSPALYGAQFDTQWWVPRFTRWWERQDRGPLYAHLRRMLQTLAWTRGGEDRPWVMKVPHFMEDLPELLAAFPGARLVCLARDPVAVVSSSASLAWHQMRLQSDAADPAAIGAEWLRRTVRRVEIADAARREYSSDAQADLSFDELDRDWLGAMHRVYAMLGLRLTEGVQARMARFIGGATAHHGHRYDPAAYSLCEASIRQAMPARA